MELHKLKNIHPAVLLFCVLEYIYWSGNGIFYSFYVPFMSQKGLSNSQIGLVLSVNALLLLITLPVWGVFTDRIKSPKIVMAMMFAGSSLIMIFIPSLKGVTAIASGICMMAIFESGIASILDSYIVQAISLVPGASYGSIRLWGSVGIVSSLAFSTGIVTSLGTKFIFYFYSACLLILIPVLKFLPQLAQNPGHRKNLNLKELFTNIRYISFLIFVVLLFIPYRFSVSFLIQTVQYTKGDTANLSFSLLMSYASEITFYFLSIYLFKHFKLLNIILFSGLFFILRQAAFSLVQHPYQVSLVQLTQGPTFTLLTASALLYIHKLAPDHLKSTAQAVGNAFLFGVSGIISNALGGYLIDNVGIVKTFYIGTSISLIAVIVFAVFNYFSRTDQSRDYAGSTNT